MIVDYYKASVCHSFLNAGASEESVPIQSWSIIFTLDWVSKYVLSSFYHAFFSVILILVITGYASCHGLDIHPIERTSTHTQA